MRMHPGASLQPTMLLFLMFFLSFLPWLIGAKAPVLSSREILLNTFQTEKLQKDLPAVALTLESSQTLWFAGKSSLWRWSLHDQRLSQIKLSEHREKAIAPLQHLVSDGTSLFAASGEQLFQISFEPLTVYQYRPLADSGHSYGLTLQHDKVFWIKKDAIYAINKKERSLSLWKKHTPLQEHTANVLLPDQHKLWFIADNHLYAIDYLQKNPEPKLIYQTKYRFTGLQSQDDYLLVHTRHTVLHFSQVGELIRTIPVEGRRRIVRMDLAPTLHSYLFHDRLLERHNLTEKKTLYSYLAVGRVKKAGPMTSNRSIVAIILDGMPRVFQLEGQW